MLEANLLPLKERRKILSAKLMEKIQRDEGNPSFELAARSITIWKKNDLDGWQWRSMVIAAAKDAGIYGLPTAATQHTESTTMDIGRDS